MQLHIEHATIHLTIPPGIPGQLLEFPSILHGAAHPDTPTPAATPPAHGDYWPGQGGRFICTLPALLGVPARHLVAADSETDDVAFGPSLDVPGAASQLDGPANTAALLATGQAHPAAKWAAAYTADGHADFFLPSRLDLVMAHICAPQLFQKSGWYWSSTQGSRHGAFVQDFESGNSGWGGKDNGHRVRAFRWVQDLNA
jgi:hypothetical protein